ncbi:MAG: phage tail tape measure protein, partial [Pseudomonadota bacterium]
MAEKRVSVRLGTEGARGTKDDLKEVGEAGATGMKRFAGEVTAANQRLAQFGQQARRVAKVAAAAITGALGLMVRSSLRTVDAQAKLARSLNTTTASVQVLTRAGQLAGVSLGQIEQAGIQLERRLSNVAATGKGPVADALRAINLTAAELQELPLDERIALIQQRLEDLIPVGERAAITTQLFGDRAGVVFARIDTTALRTATEDLRSFGVLVSEQDAEQIQRTNDALSRLGLIWTGIANRLTAAVAPAIELVADLLAETARVSSPLGQIVQGLIDNVDRLAIAAGLLAGVLATRAIVKVAAFALGLRGAATAVAALGLALRRLPFVAVLALMADGIARLGELVTATGGWGNALTLLGDVAREVWDRIKLGASAMVSGLNGVWSSLRAGFLEALAGMEASWAVFLEGINQAAEAVGLGQIGDAVAAGNAAAQTFRDSQDAAQRGRQFAALSRLQALGVTERLTSLDALRNASANAPTPETLPPRTPPTTDPLGGGGGRGGAGGPAIGQVQARVVTPDMIAQINTGVRKTGEEAAAAADSFERMGQVITGPLQDFVRQGEFNLRSLADTGARILSGFADKLITSAFKPLEDALGSLFKGLSDSGGGGLGGVFSSLFGGVGSLFGFAK